MIHRFVDLFDEPVALVEPDIVFLAQEASPFSFFSLWKAGNLATPERFDTTIISSLNSTSDFLADPELSPDGTQVVYCRAGSNTTPRQNRIYVVDWNDTATTQILSESGGLVLSLQPTWKPDGSQILYRGKGASTSLTLIKVCDPDGTNVTTLYTQASGLSVFNPTYNHDGSKIGWIEQTSSTFPFLARIRVMDSDGSNVSTVFACSGDEDIGVVNGVPAIAWAHSSNTIAFRYRADTAFTTDTEWRKVNSDGTGLTTLHTVSRAGYGPTDVDPYPITWSWLRDDSSIITTLQTRTDPSPNHYLAYIAADGSGASFPVVKASPGGSPDFRPVVFANRIYFGTASPLTQLSSVDLSGGDERVDFDGTAFSPTVTFHGFRGDTINI
jgi:hypothetical protein